MNGKKGYVSFVDKEVKENEIIKKPNIIVYGTIADSLRFVGKDDNAKVALVTVIGEYENFDSEYYGYFNMTKTDAIKIEKVYDYKEVVDIMKKESNEEQLERFIRSYILTENDKAFFGSKGLKTWKDIKYYQDNVHDVYENMEYNKEFFNQKNTMTYKKKNNK